MHDFPARLAVISRRQHGLFTAAQSHACGLSRTTTVTLIRRGVLRRVERGVFHHVVVPRTWRTDHLRLLLAAGHGAAASHRSAAALWGIEGYSARTPELTVPRGQRFRRRGAIVHESTDLDRTDIVIRDGIPTTDLPRTLLDLARTESDESVALSVQWCRRNLGLTWPQVTAVLRRHARRGRPGIRRLRRVIAAHAHRSEISDSAFEDLTIALLVESGLPEPVLHHRVRLGDRLVVLDLAYPGLRIAIELDGLVHTEPGVFRADRRRQNAVILDGWLVLRFTWDDFCRHPDRIVGEIRAAVSLRSAAS